MTLFDFSTRASLLLALVLCVVWALPRRSAALRHWLIAASIISTLLLPLLELVAPDWRVSVPASVPIGLTPDRYSVESAQVVASVDVVRMMSSAAPAYAAPRLPARMPTFLLLIWGVGVTAGVGALIAGIGRLSWVIRRSQPVTEPRWLTGVADMAHRYAFLRPVRLLECDDASMLVACGWWRPTILLPPAAREWDSARIRIVLAHELAHIVRGDWVLQVAAEWLRAMLWFNPLAWLASRRLRAESERACDDLVLASGVDAADYADELVTLARALQPERLGTPAPAMARPSSLERRVSAMLDPHLTHAATGRLTRASVLACATAVAVLVAGFGVGAQSFSSVSGRTMDPFGGHIGGVTLSLSHQTSGQRYEVKSNTSGTFEVVGVIAGEYLLEAHIPGFRTVRRSLVVGGRTVQQNVTLPVGDLEETISIVGEPPPPPPPPPPPAPPGPPLPPEMPRQATIATAETCVPTLSGGLLTPPTKTTDTRPILPPGRAGERIAERFVFHATIGIDGTVTEITPIDPAGDVELVTAAMDAIQQWRYTPTLLNCAPIPVSMTVTVGFRN